MWAFADLPDKGGRPGIEAAEAGFLVMARGNAVNSSRKIACFRRAGRRDAAGVRKVEPSFDGIVPNQAGQIPGMPVN